jgi:predicted RNA methylase
MKSSKQILGQYLTPAPIAHLLVAQLPKDTSAVIDLSAGDCALLKASRKRLPKIALYGCEIDADMYSRARSSLPAASIQLIDGLQATIRVKPGANSRVSIVANPPYTETVATPAMTKTLRAAFPGVSTKLGHKRAELYFLARALLIAQKTGGVVSILMPMGFGDGDVYKQYRASLMKNYGLLKAIEVSAVFEQTEARTVLLVIDTSMSVTKKVEISRFSSERGDVQKICCATLEAGERLDARYHDGKALVGKVKTRLQDIGVTVVRGRMSYKESRDLSMLAVHTCDLAKALKGKLDVGVQNTRNAAKNTFFSEILAEKGDILLSRTGTRVSWKPIVVTSGSAPITDHVFRIRVPADQKQRVTRAFSHPAFEQWLASISKGVCATVVTKKDLMTMPIFE